MSPGGMTLLLFSRPPPAAILGAMRYDLDAGRRLALRDRIGIFDLIHAETPQRFHARNPFPIGGVYEDPAHGYRGGARGLPA